MNILAEYIWLDGTDKTQSLRSKTRVISVPDEKVNDSRILPTVRIAINNKDIMALTFPVWGFDGSSTGQASGDSSDCLLKPVFVALDPIRGGSNTLVLCEVLNVDGTPHASNTRSKLSAVLAESEDDSPWFGFEQEYTFMMGENQPLGFQNGKAPNGAQGPYYCSVGARNAHGRPIVEKHLKACMDAGLQIYGINAEVCPGQWEFQVGPRGDLGGGPLDMSDNLWVARWLLLRIAEDFGVVVTFHPKPRYGDWNGAGMHTNFSTGTMRSPSTGKAEITRAIEALASRHKEHVADYGDGIELRLTGDHETCQIDEFRHGVSDRGASIRVPADTDKNGYGYIEDRRPNANADPYKVANRILATLARPAVKTENSISAPATTRYDF